MYLYIWDSLYKVQWYDPAGQSNFSLNFYRDPLITNGTNRKSTKVPLQEHIRKFKEEFRIPQIGLLSWIHFFQ